MILTTFLYLIACCIGIGITYVGYERGSILMVIIGGVISTIGITGGANEIISDVVTAAPTRFS